MRLSRIFKCIESENTNAVNPRLIIRPLKPTDLQYYPIITSTNRKGISKTARKSPSQAFVYYLIEKKILTQWRASTDIQLWQQPDNVHHVSHENRMVISGHLTNAEMALAGTPFLRKSMFDKYSCPISSSCVALLKGTRMSGKKKGGQSLIERTRFDWGSQTQAFPCQSSTEDRSRKSRAARVFRHQSYSLLPLQSEQGGRSLLCG